MRNLLRKLHFVLSGEYYRERARKRAEDLSERERARKEAAARDAAERLARIREDRRRELEKQKAAARAKQEEMEQTLASRAAYFRWQQEIINRAPEDRPKATSSEVSGHQKSKSGRRYDNYSNRGFFGGWHRTSKGWRKG